MNNLSSKQQSSSTSAQKLYSTLAALTLTKSKPLKVDMPSGSSRVRKGFGGFIPGILISLAALAVPHGGAMKTPLTAGC